MKYDLQFKPRSIKDLKRLPANLAATSYRENRGASLNLTGDVKQLTSFTPEYRLRVGDYRVLFEIESSAVVVYRVRHRREAYRK